ncbi:DUF5677 domain-containing protein [Azoarcus sp. DN11]|uniref:DUF5677 domain-containing protein n=1 Tax=Azoarcus sp. DN11 TaxID=356837 RepID=UPI000EB42BBF|nr:DUF5677 domain-containing protein [Azoarcus sp. DN11]AYH43959.1 hypothetical protein CDA09_11260 [Azoarcus sp. DN11]
MFERHTQSCIRLAASIRFNSENRQHLLSLCLYCSVIELCPSLVILIQRGEFIGLPHLIRSMYEASIDLANALKNPEYFESLYAGYLAKLIGVMQQAHDSAAPGFITATGSIEAIRSFLKEKKKELAALKKAGHEPLQIGQRFEIAVGNQEYLSAYAYLCGYAHNDIAALEARHLRKCEDGDVKLIVFEEIGAQNETHLIDLANTVLLGASGRTHRFFESDDAVEIDSLVQELNAFREQWPAEKESR